MHFTICKFYLNKNKIVREYIILELNLLTKNRSKNANGSDKIEVYFSDVKHSFNSKARQFGICLAASHSKETKAASKSYFHGHCQASPCFGFFTGLCSIKIMGMQYLSLCCTDSHFQRSSVNQASF